MAVRCAVVGCDDTDDVMIWRGYSLCDDHIEAASYVDEAVSPEGMIAIIQEVHYAAERHEGEWYVEWPRELSAAWLSPAGKAAMLKCSDGLSLPAEWTKVA